MVLVFSTSLKNLRISTGNNTQKILTNKICKNTIDTIIIPEFKQGNFYKGIKKGLEELMRK
ncbi:TPM domain-containing protein [Lutibacter sp. TH_r2]|uniref:TPM domain-containing protein n=1 Tax=Lutibacter sp. TH_r2 TaxID=3082083 RepID=UPI002954A4B9|nr:TPM domain-containing protein [Lutibacter sp. TH_r2]MDV7187344.1 TPM domain-containing protein [Lutibacter sp. TH_r2]